MSDTRPVPAPGDAAPEPANPPPRPNPLLRRSRTDRVLGGVCGGLGRYFDIDPYPDPHPVRGAHDLLRRPVPRRVDRAASRGPRGASRARPAARDMVRRRTPACVRRRRRRCPTRDRSRRRRPVHLPTTGRMVRPASCCEAPHRAAVLPRPRGGVRRRRRRWRAGPRRVPRCGHPLPPVVLGAWPRRPVGLSSWWAPGAAPARGGSWPWRCRCCSSPALRRRCIAPDRTCRSATAPGCRQPCPTVRATTSAAAPPSSTCAGSPTPASSSTCAPDIGAGRLRVLRAHRRPAGARRSCRRRADHRHGSAGDQRPGQQHPRMLQPCGFPDHRHNRRPHRRGRHRKPAGYAELVDVMTWTCSPWCQGSCSSQLLRRSWSARTPTCRSTHGSRGRSGSSASGSPVSQRQSQVAGVRTRHTRQPTSHHRGLLGPKGENRVVARDYCTSTASVRTQSPTTDSDRSGQNL